MLVRTLSGIEGIVHRRLTLCLVRRAVHVQRQVGRGGWVSTPVDLIVRWLRLNTHYHATKIQKQSINILQNIISSQHYKI